MCFTNRISDVQRDCWGGLAYRYVSTSWDGLHILQVSDSGSQVQYVILGAVFIKQSKIFQQFEHKSCPHCLSAPLPLMAKGMA